MLRSKALTEKILFLGIDGMDPTFSKKMLEKGKLPNLKILLERGAAREDLRLLGAVPTITPPMWTTLATGAYPMTHGIEDFNINIKGELDVNFAGIYSTHCHAEPLWNKIVESGKKTLVWHWPGGAWPPTSESENLYVVDGTSPGGLGFGYASRDWEYFVFASTKATEAKFYHGGLKSTEHFTGDPAELENPPLGHAGASLPKDPHYDELWEKFKEGIDINGYKPKKYMDYRAQILMPNGSQMDTLRNFPIDVSLSPISEPIAWNIEIPTGAKEFTMIEMKGHITRPCLILKNKEGQYDKLAIYLSKDIAEPLGIIERDIFTQNIPDVIPKGNSGEMEHVIRNMRALDIAEDGSFVRLWVSGAISVDDKSVWYPNWIFDKVTQRFGPPVPTGQLSGGDLEIINKCNLEQWRCSAKWQANGMKYMMDHEGVEAVFSHYHAPDICGHTYMYWLKDREDSPHAASAYIKAHEACYEMTDAYIGEFLPYLEQGWTIFLFSDHAQLCREGDAFYHIGDNFGVNTGVMLELGYTALKKDENGNYIPEIDWENTRAIQQRSNSIFINLKGRDRFGIVDPADKYELEEQIITDLYGYRDKKTGHRVISLALHQKDANLFGLGGEYTSGDIIFFVHDDYCGDHGESLSTATGHANTSVGPIFVAAGPGIKENYKLQLFPREVDLAPTAAILLGVGIPAQCEGAPIYNMLSEEL